MAKSPEEIAAIRLESAQIYTEGIREGNSGLGACLQMAPESWLCLGLCQWRHHLDHPQKAFENAIATTERAFQFLLAVSTREELWDNFVLEKADILRLLLDKPVDTAEMESFVETGMFDGDPRTLNVILTVSLAKRAAWGPWVKILKKKRSKSEQLFFETFRQYHDVITSHGDNNVDDMVEAIGNAADCFNKRKTDSAFSEDLISEGGGDSNEDAVDYRLGALIKRLLPASELPRLSENALIHVYPD